MENNQSWQSNPSQFANCRPRQASKNPSCDLTCHDSLCVLRMLMSLSHLLLPPPRLAASHKILQSCASQQALQTGRRGAAHMNIIFTRLGHENITKSEPGPAVRTLSLGVLAHFGGGRRRSPWDLWRRSGGARRLRFGRRGGAGEGSLGREVRDLAADGLSVQAEEGHPVDGGHLPRSRRTAGGAE